MKRGPIAMRSRRHEPTIADELEYIAEFADALRIRAMNARCLTLAGLLELAGREARIRLLDAAGRVPDDRGTSAGPAAPQSSAA
jgi:hypothetical protein